MYVIPLFKIFPQFPAVLRINTMQVIQNIHDVGLPSLHLHFPPFFSSHSTALLSDFAYAIPHLLEYSTCPAISSCVQYCSLF